MTNEALVQNNRNAMRLRNRILPQAGTRANSNGEPRPGPSSSGCPTYSGEGTVSHHSAQLQTAADQHDALTSCSSPTSSLFPSLPSSPPSYVNKLYDSSSSISSLMSHQSPEDVIQEATSANSPVSATGGSKTRKKWSEEMNIFILRTYFIVTSLELNVKNYLTPLHSKFTEKFPHMQASKQRLGDQRRAIVQKQLLTEEKIKQIKAEVETYLKNHPESNSQSSVTNNERLRWTTHINETIIRTYYRITNLESNLTAYREQLHREVITICPSIAHVSVQRIADQRRAIINNRYISVERLEEIKDEVRTELVRNQENVINSSTRLNDTQDHASTVIISYTQPNQNEYPSTNQIETVEQDRSVLPIDKQIEIENNFKDILAQFKNSNPTGRPLIPRQKTSRKFAVIVNFLNTHVIPKVISDDTDFDTIQLIIYTAAYTAAKQNGTKFTNTVVTSKSQIPKWQENMQIRINKLRTNIGRLTEYIKGNQSPRLKRKIDEIMNRFKIHSSHENPNSDLSHFLDTLKQKLSVLSSRLRRYKDTTLRKTQNRLFTRNEKVFYRTLVQNNLSPDGNSHNIPSKETLQEYWSGIWSNPVVHKNSEWIEEDRDRVKNIPVMEFDSISLELLQRVIHRTLNWKATGSDKLHNYWYKKFTSTHIVLLKHINIFFQEPHTIPKYITEGITYMLPKDPSDTVNPAKYRPITCLQTIYKIMTSCISELIYTHIHNNNVLMEEQKGCRKDSQGCKEQLTIDAVACNQAHTTNRNIYSMYIDYKKAYDSVPHSWLLFILKHYNIHPKIITFLKSVMTTWKTILKLHSNNQTIESEYINIKRGLFQGDALSPLWFCLSLNPLSTLLNNTKKGFKIKFDNSHYTLSHLLYMDDIKLFGTNLTEIHTLADITESFSSDIHMEFGIDKCNILSIRRGQLEHNCYKLRDNRQIEPVDEIHGYKYLGYQQTGQIHHKQTKNILIEKFKSRIHKILNTHLNARNTVKGINTYAIPILTYSFGIIKWSATDIKNLQRKINVIMTKYRKHHPRACVQRQTLPRAEGGRGLIDLNNLHTKQIETLRNFFNSKSQNSELHRAVVRADRKYTPLNLSEPSMRLNHTTNTQKLDAWTQKSLHGRHRLDLTNPNVDKTASNAWLKRGEMFPETEGFMIAIQDQTIDTKNYRKYIIKDPTAHNDLCRHCHSSPETIQHVTGACKSITQTDYKHRHDQVAAIVHQHLAYKYKLIIDKMPYYKYSPKIILESVDYKLYWDRTIMTDKTIHHNRPDITLHDKRNKAVFLIDVAIPNTHNLQTTYTEKIAKYTDLAIELKRQWRVDSVRTVPIVVSTTGVIPKYLHTSLKTLQIHPLTYTLMQKAVILNTCRIVRKFLSIETQ